MCAPDRNSLAPRASAGTVQRDSMPISALLHHVLNRSFGCVAQLQHRLSATMLLEIPIALRSVWAVVHTRAFVVLELLAP
jgi:hypothetical protein